MRINLTKKDVVILVYMQLGFSKQISENLIDVFFSLISSNLLKKKVEKKVPPMKKEPAIKEIVKEPKVKKEIPTRAANDPRYKS